MKLTYKDLTIEISHLSRNDILEDWRWMIGEDMNPVMVTSIGDVFLQSELGNIFWLDVGGGELTKVADSFDEFRSKLNDDEIANEWFMFNLVSQIKESGLELEDGKLFGYKKLPVIGGEYHSDNFELTDISIHFSLAGQIHRQIRDLPDGTKVNIKFKK